MSVQLIKDEKIVKSYDYAISHSKGPGAANGTKTLIITNKRIIHKESFSGGNGTGLNISEMPISEAKYVNTSFKVTRHPVFLVLGILFAIEALFTCLLGRAVDVPMAVSLLPLALAIVFFVVYALKKTYLFACSIDTNTYITNAFRFSSVSGNSRTKRFLIRDARESKNFYIRVKVDSAAVQEMANELGSVIAAAANGDYDE